MEKHNFAAYNPGTFSVDVSNLQAANPLFDPKDMPAFIHEYCHYVQDVTTISSVFGFSLWMRDVVALTRVFSVGSGKSISIPLPRDEHNQTINKFRKLYNLYCGDAQQVFDIDFTRHPFVKRVIEEKKIDLHGAIQGFAANTIELGNRPEPLFFGLIVLQEIQAFYAQRLAEEKSPGVELSIYADDLPSFPYQFGDFLFDHYNIRIDLPTKYILADLCLDTVQAPTVFLDVLESLQGQTVAYFGENRMDLVSLVREHGLMRGCSREVALENILPDIERWSQEPGREHLCMALRWYLDLVKSVYLFKEASPDSATFFSMPFTRDWGYLALLFDHMPPPVYIRDGILLGTGSLRTPEAEEMYQLSYEAATTIWSHRVLYDLLTSETIEQIATRCQCPLYTNCEKKIVLAEEYTCKMAPWEIVKGKSQAPCEYGMAAHSFGLWQNSLEIN